MKSIEVVAAVHLEAVPPLVAVPVVDGSRVRHPKTKI